MMIPLHHGEEGTSAGFDGVTIAILVVVALALVGIGFGIWKLARRMRGY